MTDKIIFLEPVLKSMIWGGNKLKTDFGYKSDLENIGECWGISANKNGDCSILEGEFKGSTLSELWAEKKELFGNFKSEVFPLLVKIIDAKKDLSIQVHPDDEYAKKYSSPGKTESWLILDCEKDASIIIGHNARSKKELISMIDDRRWSEFIREVPIKKGDFFHIEPGCLHAIKGGTLLIEIQQNSDITFRVYDYDRLQGTKPRELHLKESIDCIKVPFVCEENKISTEQSTAYDKIHYIDCKYYSIDEYKVKADFTYKNIEKFSCISVIEGQGTVSGKNIKKGDHFILLGEEEDFEFLGDLRLIAAHPKENQA